MPATPHITDEEYEALAAVRYQMRRFLTFSESAARAAGVEPQQHQLLLAIRGLPSDRLANVKALAERLQIRHHSAVELIQRADAAGLVTRVADRDDGRRVTLRLTRHGAAVLERLSRQHRSELATAGKALVRAMHTLTRATAEPDDAQ
jgi:DNA-binding MarR family transcriptional regulator